MVVISALLGWVGSKFTWGAETDFKEDDRVQQLQKAAVAFLRGFFLLRPWIKKLSPFVLMALLFVLLLCIIRVKRS